MLRFVISSCSTKVANLGDNVDEEKRYAEMWMGTHPKAPCLCSPDGSNAGTVPLLDLIRSDVHFWLGTSSSTTRNLSLLALALLLEIDIHLR